MKRPSLRALLLGAVLLALLAGFGSFAAYIDSVERASRLDDIDSELVRASRAQVQPPQPPVTDGRPTPPPGPRVGAEAASEQPIAEDGVDGVPRPLELLIDQAGLAVPPPVDPVPLDTPALAALAGSEGFTTVDSPRFRVLTSATDRGLTRLTGLPLDDFDAAGQRFRRALAIGGGVILALVAGVVWLLTNLLTRPVARMAESARRIAGGELDAPIPRPAGSRETFELSQDLDRMVGRMRGSIDEATEARDDMERFLADMAHEIRTPLTALKGYSDLYSQGMLTSEVDIDRAMTRIGSESERLQDLAENMLQLARNELTDDPQTRLDLAEVVQTVVDDLQAANPDVTVELRSPTGVVAVFGARHRLHQGLLNLGANACRFSPPDRAVTFEVDVEGATSSVRVVDHGPGVAPDEAERIFAPFYRADLARHRSGGVGAGLGLALTRQIVDQHGGTLSLDETPGGGATFTVTLPTTGRADSGPN